VIVWLHGDHLRDDNPALKAYPDAPVVFVFDEDFLRDRQFAFHRLFFLYESVVEVFQTRGGVCSIRKGEVVAEVSAFAREHGATTIATTRTVGSRFAAYQTELGKVARVQAFRVPSLVVSDAATVPRRFSAWWRGVEEQALR
jgi:hypothetical protein